MKAYTIKNKNGEYLSRYTNYDYRYSENDHRNICWTNNEANIRFMSENGAKYTLKELNLEDCEIVKIIIAEDNLEELKDNELIDECRECYKKLLEIYSKLNIVNYLDPQSQALVKIDKMLKFENQKAIECLKDIKEELRRLDKVYKPKPTSDLISVLYKLDNYCDTKIKELEGEKDE